MSNLATELNPKLWQTDEMSPGKLDSAVNEKLLEIVDNFINYLKEDEIDLVLKDIVLVGSNVNFNYTPESDIDVHIIADMSHIEDEEERRLLLILYNAYKSIFNKKFDILIKGHEAEIYVEADETATVSGGIYSLIDGWLRTPEREVFIDDETTSDEYTSEFNKWKERFDLISTNIKDTSQNDDAKLVKSESLSDTEKTELEEISSFLVDIYAERRSALAIEGENSVLNKVFKQFRRLGYLKQLRDRKTELEAREMSLEALDEARKVDESELFWHLRDGLVSDTGEFYHKTKYSERARDVIEREITNKLPGKEGNVRLVNGKIKHFANPEEGFSVSGEQYNGHQLSRTEIEEFNKAVEGEFVMYFYSTGPYGKEYSSYTHNEELCQKACAGEINSKFAKQESYAEFIGPNSEPLFKNKDGEIV